MEGRGAAENSPQELVRIDLSKLDPSEYTVHPNGYVTFKSAVPESFISKVLSPGKGIPADAAVPQEAAQYLPQVPTESNMFDLLQRSIALARSRRK